MEENEEREKERHRKKKEERHIRGEGVKKGDRRRQDGRSRGKVERPGRKRTPSGEREEKTEKLGKGKKKTGGNREREKAGASSKREVDLGSPAVGRESVGVFTAAIRLLRDLSTFSESLERAKVRKQVVVRPARHRVEIVYLLRGFFGSRRFLVVSPRLLDLLFLSRLCFYCHTFGFGVPSFGCGRLKNPAPVN